MPRFMLFMYPGISDAEYAEGPTADNVAEMTRFNQELVNAGALLAADGLRPSAEGARISVSGGTRVVTDGPFSEAKEMVGGYWIIQAKDREEAVEWARRVPLVEGPFVEVRQIYEMSDFPEDVQAAAELSETPPHQTSA